MSVRPATWSDLQGVFALRSAQQGSWPFAEPAQLAELRASWEKPGFEVGRDNWVVEHDGAVVAYGALDKTQRIAHVASERHPGDALLDQILIQASERGFSAVTVTGVAADHPLNAMLLDRGLTLERTILRMWKALTGDDPRPEWPGGVTVRSYRPIDAERVHGLLDEAYAGWDAAYRPTPHADWTAFMIGDSEFDPSAWWLAERGGQLAGCALHWRSGWLKDFAVRESERHQGLGTALLRNSFAEFARRGIGRMGLKVDIANPTGAVRMYERHGFVADQTEEDWALCP